MITNYKTERKIQKYAYKMLSGDKAAENKIIEHYSKAIIDVIENDYTDTSIEKEDLIQTGLLALVSAIRNYKSEYGYFSTYVKNKIKHYITKALIRENNFINIHSTDLKNINETNSKNFITKLEYIEIIQNSIKRLPKRNQEIIILHIYKNYTLKEIAKICNVSNSRIQQIYQKYLESIKAELLYYQTYNNLNLNQNEMKLGDFLMHYFYEYDATEIQAAMSLLTKEKQLLLKTIKISNNYDDLVFNIIKKLKKSLKNNSNNNIDNYSKIKK